MTSLTNAEARKLCEQCLNEADLGDLWFRDNFPTIARYVLTRLGQEDRMFPIMGGPDIPWSVIAPYNSQAEANHHQSLETLASRGGLCPAEAIAVLKCRRFEKMDEAEALEMLLDIVKKLRAVTPAVTREQLIDALLKCDGPPIMQPSVNGYEERLARWHASCRKAAETRADAVLSLIQSGGLGFRGAVGA